MSLAAVLISLFLLTYGALAVIALRRPMLGRLALREAIRRPGQSALIVLGLMVGTTAIYSMQLLSDSLVQSDSAASYRAWGHVDLVAADGGRFFDPSLAFGLASDARVKASTVGVQAGVELQGSAIDLSQNNAKPLVLIVGFDPATQAPFGAYELRGGRKTLGNELAAGDVLLAASLADALQAQIGDRLRVAASPDQTADLRVAGIAEARGPGAYGLRPAVFAPLASMRLVTGGPEINVIRVASGGEGRAELDRAHEAVHPVRTALAALPGGRDLRVREAKRDDVEATTALAEGPSSIFTGLGILVALAGVTLVVILALALAEERRPRHAVLRALGLTRSGLIVLSVLEGGVYSAIAALLAPITGAVLGLLIVKFVARLLRTDLIAMRATEFQPVIEPGSVAVAVAVGGLITLGTLFATSFRSSRMEISSAVKNLPEPPPRRIRSMWRTLALGALGLAAVGAVVAGNSPIRLAGGAVLILLAASVARTWLSARVLAALAGAALAIWAGVSAAEEPLNSGVGLLVLALAPPVAVFGLSLFLAANLRLLATAAGWLSGGAKATLMPSLAYLTRRPLRAGLGIGAFALVLTLMTILAILSPLQTFGATKALDEYDIRVNAPTHPGLTLPDSVRSQIVRDVALPTRSYVGDVRVRVNDVDQTHPADYLPLYTLSREQLLAAPVRLYSRESRYRSDADVWRALASDPSLVVTASYALGFELTLTSPNGPVHFRTVAILATVGLSGLLGSDPAMAPFTTLPLGTTILARTAPGADPRAVAREIQRDVFAQGGEAIAIQEMLDSLTGYLQAIFNTLQLAVGIGLLVGVLSLGILALRAVIERRRSIGMLRALGYGPLKVLAGMLVEVLLTATSGAVVGIGVGIVMGALVVRSIAGSANVEVEVATLAWTLGLMYTAVLVVTIGPALRAARLAPSEALRVVD
jgi:putative ABC transport system permease protein